ncbi:hypothetical protein ACFQY7_21925 [Actinomadura luteofluorescens]|uniref:hypothetical protein n=1 Tax=Actinomadura luteofluorescens TaxID=46163 RepID=UPI00363EBF61
MSVRTPHQEVEGLLPSAVPVRFVAEDGTDAARRPNTRRRRTRRWSRPTAGWCSAAGSTGRPPR